MTYLSTEFAPRPSLEYPFEKKWSPKAGEPYEVAKGLYWLRVPLPISLDHINLWLLEDGDGWVIVDSGYDASMCKDVWESVFTSFIKSKPVNKIIITHFHPDHIGLASWLALRCDCPILITKGEFNHYQNLVHRDPKALRAQANAFVTQMGYEADVAEKFVQFMAADDKPASARVQQSMCEFIQDADELIINGRTWRVVSGNGHSPEHACLYCSELDVLISGDQAIPRISSHVGVYPSNRDQDPLGDWLDSCAKLRDTIPPQTLILPSHQEPFRGIVPRMQQLIVDHHAQLNRLRLEMDTPSSPVQARAILFNRELSVFDTILATGETLAHLNYLLHRHELVMQLDELGVARYQINQH